MCRENSDLKKRIGQAKLDPGKSRPRFIYKNRKKLKIFQLFSVKSTT